MTKAKTIGSAGASSLRQFAKEKLAKINDAGLLRKTIPTDRTLAMSASRKNKNVISFADNDFLGLSMDQSVIEAAKEAAGDYGSGAGASRLVTGDHSLYTVLEETIARIKGTEAAIVFGNGFMTNLGVIPSLVQQGDIIIADEMIHASMHAGCKLSGAEVVFFKHNDVADAKALIKGKRKNYRHALLLVEGVYSMDGDVSPIKELGELAEAHETWFMVDDAHGFGTLGDGRGTVQQANATNLVPLQMGTLSKAAGSYGGFLAGDKHVIELMKNRARSLIYTTGLPPTVVAASIKALEIIEKDKNRCAAPLKHARYFTKALGLPEPQSAIVPLIIGSANDAMSASKTLEGAGFIATAFRPPTVAEGKSRLRFCFSATHRIEDIDRLIDVIQSMGLLKGSS